MPPPHIGWIVSILVTIALVSGSLLITFNIFRRNLRISTRNQLLLIPLAVIQILLGTWLAFGINIGEILNWPEHRVVTLESGIQAQEFSRMTIIRGEWLGSIVAVCGLLILLMVVRQYLRPTK